VKSVGAITVDTEPNVRNLRACFLDMVFSFFICIYVRL